MRDYEVFYPFVVATFFAEIFCGSHILRLWHTHCSRFFMGSSSYKAARAYINQGLTHFFMVATLFACGSHILRKMEFLIH